jgi:hypothetical protein
MPQDLWYVRRERRLSRQLAGHHAAGAASLLISP